MASAIPGHQSGSSEVAFNTFVTKVVSRCNLNCDYCYMYNLQDRTWRNQPSIMKADVRDALADRIRRHCKAHGISSVHIILHGGEPLLLGQTKLREWVETVRDQLSDVTRPWFSIQSNGTLVDDEWVDTLAEAGAGIGISIDGPEFYHDLHRRDHQGNGSFGAVRDAIDTLRTHPQGSKVFSSVMAVVNCNIPPSEMFRFWQELDIRGFDLTIPHANHVHPPPDGAVSYGDWLIEFFDLWFDWNRPDRRVRYFENIIRMLFGFPISTDNIGGRPVGVVVVETDGSIEPTDAFKCCSNGMTKLGLNVLEHDFDALYNIPMVRTLQSGRESLCDTCRRCDAFDVCGGGYMPHRFAQSNGFDNPSVYCNDIYRLVHHIRKRVMQAIPDSILCKLENASE